MFKEYFKELEEESIRDNFVTVYELMDEVMDFGFPQTTDSKILQEWVLDWVPVNQYCSLSWKAWLDISDCNTGAVLKHTTKLTDIQQTDIQHTTKLADIQQSDIQQTTKHTDIQQTKIQHTTKLTDFQLTDFQLTDI